MFDVYDHLGVQLKLKVGLKIFKCVVSISAVSVGHFSHAAFCV